MRISFPYEDRNSRLLGKIKRPYARVSAWSHHFQAWLDYAMIVDTGADYTLFPRSVAADLGINLEEQSEQYETKGVGGKETVFLLKDKLRLRIGEMEREVIAGMLARDDIPPLLGRTACLDLFDLLFSQAVTTFDEPGVLVTIRPHIKVPFTTKDKTEATEYYEKVKGAVVLA